MHKAGLPVPPALALCYSLALAVEAASESALRTIAAATSQLSYPLAVRSSANIEDRKSGAAPGLFDSRLGIRSQQELVAAIVHVLESTRTPLVQAYLKAQHIEQTPTLAVIVQEQISSSVACGVLYTRPPGRPESDVAILEVAKLPPVWIDRESGTTRAPAGAEEIAKLAPKLWELASAAEEILGADGGLDIEWVWDHRGPWIVQARPVVHKSSGTPAPELQKLLSFSLGDMDKLWRLDATHNPFPCSPAQAGLVEMVRPLAPYDMRVVGGYLYVAKRAVHHKPLAPDRSDRHAQEQAEALPNAASLHALFRDQLFPKMDAALKVPESQNPPSLSCALKAYRDVFRCYTEELSPVIAALGESDTGANPLTIWLERAKLGEISLQELMDAVAPMAPAWDVSVPTYRETPELVEAAMKLATGQNQESSLSLRESDDLLFFRAQAQVRRALQGLATRWQLGDDIFFLPLAELLSEEERAEPLPSWHAQALRARTKHQEELSTRMPLAFINGEAVPTRLPPNTELWSGIGTGASVRGTVVRVQKLRSFPRIASGDNTVLVMPSLSPAHALAARGCVAIVCEYGDHLGHGAAMARELEIPCIVGCTGAWRELRTGDHVLVHGQAGLVARTERVKSPAKS
ncbi:MAG: hypothetical protein JKY56_23700 [Kofleriaceae bacterium]|nr:hypothetical protein [Kofleriaceae bacterium]